MTSTTKTKQRFAVGDTVKYSGDPEHHPYIVEVVEDDGYVIIRSCVNKGAWRASAWRLSCHDGRKATRFPM
jgi:hypothetical protein